MNENKRVLLLALGIMMIVVSDPPVASYFEQPRSVCTIVSDLAVGAFDSLVHSTLPLPDNGGEVEISDEILIAGDPGTKKSEPPSAPVLLEVRMSDRASSDSIDMESVAMVGNQRLAVSSDCAGASEETSGTLHVETYMEVSASTVEHG